MLQDMLNDLDWGMFRACTADINKFTEVAVSFVSMLAEEIIPTARVVAFPNQKQWVDRSICAAVNAGTGTADMSAYKVPTIGDNEVVREDVEAHHLLLHPKHHRSTPVNLPTQQIHRGRHRPCPAHHSATWTGNRVTI